MSNREKLMSISDDEEENDSILERITEGAKAMKVARRMRDGVVLDLGCEQEEYFAEEEVVLCVVLTNAVEVQGKNGRYIGIAVYDTNFSWINHSCSPNACFQFCMPPWAGGESRLRIFPAAMAGGGKSELNGDSVCNYKREMTSKECERHGPRLVVRSIKTIKKGEVVSIAYTDLLHPKVMRHSELWFKYRFICYCRRCSALPPMYVDRVLKEIFAVNLDCTNLCSDHNFYREEAVKMFTECIDDTITEYLSFGNPRSCCERLENMLTHGLLDEQLEPKKETSQYKFKLHPLHYLSLNAYTTLASAYKIRGSDLLALNPESKEHQVEAFCMSRISAAYSLLLAGATQNLFLLESSLVSSVANFWTSAGESLLDLAKSSVWRLSNCGPTSEYPYVSNYKYCKCALMDFWEANSCSNQIQNSELDDISKEFLYCVTTITATIWSFLIHENCYLKLIADPIDFRWLEAAKNFETFNSTTHSGSAEGARNVSRCEAQRYGADANQERIILFRLGVHCLLYGGYLSSVCYGNKSQLNNYIQNLLHGEGNIIDAESIT
ncbi:unnamed protein product [Ilex paraguariensis]|uniref:SET domain-containing protein n=1 Tax=Ilex paraguariensis TaxID=185542 RepID=A0ABC8QQM1_9AQUA